MVANGRARGQKRHAPNPAAARMTRHAATIASRRDFLVASTAALDEDPGEGVPPRGRAAPRTALSLQTLQVGTKLSGELAAKLPVLFQCFVENGLELDRKFRIERDWGNRRLVQNAIEDHGSCSAGKRVPPGSHLVKNYPERKQIAARIQRLTARLFRRHVGNGTHRRSRSGKSAYGS
jgi:hypothetical protein